MLIDQELKVSYTKDFMMSHRIGPPTKHKFHFHDHFEIIYNLTDGTLFYINEHSYTLKKGDLILINNMDIHHIKFPTNVDFERYVLMFKPELVSAFSTPEIDLLEYFINNSPNGSQGIHLTDEQSEKLTGLLNVALRHHMDRPHGYEIYRRITLVEILVLINFIFSNEESLISHKKDNDTRAVSPILKYIKTYLNEELSLAHLAITFHFNKSYLSRLFKKTTGTNVNNYIINLRLLKARELLKEDYSVTEVCDMVGFNSYTHFISTFKKNVGISPKRYNKSELSKI